MAADSALGCSQSNAASLQVRVQAAFCVAIERWFVCYGCRAHALFPRSRNYGNESCSAYSVWVGV